MKVQMLASNLKEIMKILGHINEEHKLIFDNKGMSVNSVDAAHVAMIGLNVNKADFKEYSGMDKETKLVINTKKIDSFIKLAKNEDIITMELKDKSLQMSFNNLTRNMALLNNDGFPDAKRPNISLPAKIKLKVADIKPILKISNSIGDHINIMSNPNGVNITCTTETDECAVDINKDTMMEFQPADEEVSSMYSLEYITNMINSVPESKDLTINLGKDYPLVLEFNLTDDSKCEYLLAPRIEQD